MKKIILFLAIGLFGWYGMNFTYAADTTSGTDNVDMKITVQEKVPGANCDVKNADGTYTCTIKKGFGSALDLMGAIIKYFTYVTALLGVLFIVINGIMYSMAGGDNSLETKVKENIIKMIKGLIILFLSGLILNFVAPWIYK